jgi:hypothetical protein
MVAQVFRRARNRQGQAFGGTYAPSLTAAARDGEWAAMLGRDGVDLANRKALSVNSVCPETPENHPHFFQKRLSFERGTDHDRRVVLQIRRQRPSLCMKALAIFLAGCHCNVRVCGMRGWQNAAMSYGLHDPINTPPAVRLLVGKRIGLWHVTNVEARQVAVEKVMQEGLAPTRIHQPGDGGEIAMVLFLGV